MDLNKPHDLSVSKDFEDDITNSRTFQTRPASASISGMHTGRIRSATNTGTPSPFARPGAAGAAATLTPAQARGTPAMGPMAGRGMPLASPRGTPSMNASNSFRSQPGASGRLGKPLGSGLHSGGQQAYVRPTFTPQPTSVSTSTTSSLSSSTDSIPEPIPEPIPAPIPAPIVSDRNDDASEPDIPPPPPSNTSIVPGIPALPPVGEMDPSESDMVAASRLSTASSSPVNTDDSSKSFSAEKSFTPILDSPETPCVKLAAPPAIPDLPLLPPALDDADEQKMSEQKVPEVVVEEAEAKVVKNDKRTSSTKTIADVEIITTPAIVTPAPVVDIPALKPRTLDEHALKPSFMWSDENPQFWTQFNAVQSQSKENIEKLQQLQPALSGMVFPIVPNSRSHNKDYADLLSKVTTDPFCETASQSLLNFYGLSSNLAREFQTAAERELATVSFYQEAQAKYEEFERLNTTYQEKIKRYLQLKTTTDAKKLQEKSIKLANLQHQLEMARFAAYTAYYQVNEMMAYNIMSPLVRRVTALYDFFKVGYETFKPLAEELEVISNVVRKQTCRGDEIKTEFRRQNDIVERLASEQQRLMSASSSHTESSLAVLTNALGVTSVNHQAGVRDLDPRKMNKELGYVKRGFLHIPFPTHVRVWVELNRDHLAVYVPGKEPTKLPIVLCTVKHNKEQKLRHVFTVISPQAQFHLQAEHEAAYNMWFDVIQNAVSEGINHQQKGAESPATTKSDDFTPATTTTTSSTTVSNPSTTTATSTTAVKSDAVGTTQVAATTTTTLTVNPTTSSSSNTMEDEADVTPVPSTVAADAAVGGLDTPESILASLRTVAGNKICADCNQSDPEWVSLNLGILVCLECSGIHRALGVETSKVRSTLMDSIDHNALDFIRSIGNSVANAVWEEDLHNPVNAGYTKCHPGSTRPQREQYIRLKYQAKKFVNMEHSMPSLNISALGSEKEIRAMQAQLMSSLSTVTIQRKKNALTKRMFDAIENNDIISLYTAMCWGSDPLWSTASSEGRNAAHQSVMYGNIPAAVCVMYCCDDRGLYSKEDRGWTVLHYAAYQNNPAMIELCLIFGGSKLTAEKDANGQTPEDIVTIMNVGEEFEKDKPAVLKLLRAASAKYQARLARDARENNQ